jgi:hypothetical protein
MSKNENPALCQAGGLRLNISVGWYQAGVKVIPF